MKIMMLSGAGGVGKSSVAKELRTLSTEEFPIETVMSPSRLTYERLGIENEIEAMELDFETQYGLQEEIFKDYCKTVELSCHWSVSREKKSPKLLVIDRSPLDHCVYLMQVLPELTVIQIETRLQQSRDLFHRITDGTVGIGGNEVHLWMFPFPTRWSVDDNWRYAPGGKNYLWSLALAELANRFCMEARRTDPKVNQWHFDKDNRFALPAERAAFILNKVKTMVKGDG